MIGFLSTLCILTTPASFAPPSILDLIPHDLHSIEFKAVVMKGISAELKKINTDFARNYKFNYAVVRIEDPFRLRADSTLDDVTITVVNNGPRVMYSIPRARIHSVQDVATQPQRRQTWFDFGLLTPYLVDHYFVSRFVRMDRATGDAVFDLTFPHANGIDDNTRYRVWIDPQKHYIARREWYGQEADYRAALTYSNPKEIGGVWIPTVVIVKNAEDKLAGEMKYEDIQVNPHFAADVFEIH